MICYGQSPCIPQGLLFSKNHCQHTLRYYRHLHFHLCVGRAVYKAVLSHQKDMGKDMVAEIQRIHPTSQSVFPVPTLLPAFPLLLYVKTEACALQGCGVYAHRCPSLLQQRPVHARGHRQLGMTADTPLLFPPFAFFPSRLTCSLPLQTGHSFLGKKRSH